MRVIDYILLAIVFALVFLTLRYMRRSKSSCRGCSGCQYRDECDRRR